MPKKETLFEYQVTGFWPFPMDMLRRDQARGATTEDIALIALLSTDSISEQTPEKQSTIKLYSYDQPNRKRWESFKWIVVGTVNQVTVERPYTDEEKLALISELADMRAAADREAASLKDANENFSEEHRTISRLEAELRQARERAEDWKYKADWSEEEASKIEKSITEILRSLAE